MRVIEPRHVQAKRKRRSRRRLFVVGGYIVIGLVVIYSLNIAANKHVFRRVGSNVDHVKDGPVQLAAPKLTTPKKFTGNQFKDLYRSVMQSYPNTEAFTQPPDITGNPVADERIRKIVEARGFRQTRIPVTALVKTNEPLLQGETDDLLQPLAFKGWEDIKAAAKKDHIPLALLSAYRSPEWQRDLFMQRLLARGVSVDMVAAGQADAAVEANLDVTAVPGYSRHHTGYTVDFWCEDDSGNFGNSSCFTWLNANNYLHAKEFGWIPSYPSGADEQGPEPEPWEYVWVGRTVLYQ